MVASFKELKRNSGKTSLAEINKKIQDQESKNFNSDPRYWQPVADKDGNGSAVIRFLPPSVGETDRWVRKFTHNFKGPGGWYVENCRTTIELPDPVAEYNNELWATDIKANKDQASNQKRKLQYISNILVIKHSARPEDEGKVFLFGYGKKIFDKIKSVMNPTTADDEAFDPYDFYTGANFRLKIKKVAGYRNYDDSQFSDPTPLATDDAVLEKIWNTQYPLLPEVSADKFKPYDELKEKMDRVLKLSSTGTREHVATAAHAPGAATRTVESDLASADTDDGDDDPDSQLATFRRIAAEATAG